MAQTTGALDTSKFVGTQPFQGCDWGSNPHAGTKTKTADVYSAVNVLLERPLTLAG
jgi:hypothetical protein